MDFSLWVNEKIYEFNDELNNMIIPKDTRQKFLNHFINFCTDCINTFNKRYELENSLKGDICYKYNQFILYLNKTFNNMD